MKISLIIENLESGLVILKDDEGRIFSWPIDKLPAGSQRGDTLTFTVFTEEQAIEDADLPKRILNELLSSG